MVIFRVCGIDSYCFWSIAQETRTDCAMLLAAIYGLVTGGGRWSIDAARPLLAVQCCGLTAAAHPGLTSRDRSWSLSTVMLADHAPLSSRIRAIMSFRQAFGESATFLNTSEAFWPVSIANYLGGSGCSFDSLTSQPRSHTASLWLDLTGDGFASIA